MYINFRLLYAQECNIYFFVEPPDAHAQKWPVAQVT